MVEDNTYEKNHERGLEMVPQVNWKKINKYPQDQSSSYSEDLSLAQEKNIILPSLGNAYRRETSVPDWDKASAIDANRRILAITNYSPFFYQNEEMRRTFDDDTDIQKSLTYLRRSRVYEHLPRLLSHTDAPACANFAVTLVKHIKEIEEKDIKAHISIPDSLDGNAAMQFYTIGPYFLEELMAKGLSEGEAFKTVIDWSKNRNDDRNGSAVYPGLSDPPDFFLNKDGKHHSHTLARKIAKHLADSVIAS